MRAFEASSNFAKYVSINLIGRYDFPIRVSRCGLNLDVVRERANLIDIGPRVL
jgi:hypothetical protein